MPLEDFIIAVFCCVEQMWHQSAIPSRLRQRGFSPKLSDTEVLTMEIVGEYLGFDSDQQIWKDFRAHWRPWFPALGARSTFARQAANLWYVKQLLCLPKIQISQIRPLNLISLVQFLEGRGPVFDMQIRNVVKVTEISR